MSETRDESEIQAEIDRLRQTFPQTQDLYREACVLLFFRFGITPTANKLYQYVRKGSMSAPAEALSRFWENLREKSRVRIENPDMPDDLRIAAGELVAGLWTIAQKAASAHLQGLREQAQAETSAARQAQVAAEARRDALFQELTEARAETERAEQRGRELGEALASQKATQAGLSEQLGQARADNRAIQDALAQARRDFAAELGQIRAAAQLAEERLRAAEERALVEIDRERSAAARLQREVDAVRRAHAEGDQAQRTHIQGLHNELGRLHQQLGAVEGAQKELQAAKLELSNALDSARMLSASQASALAVAAREKEFSGARIGELEAAVGELKGQVERLSAAASAARPGARKIRDTKSQQL
jgi:chromosome segregation ATPase